MASVYGIVRSIAKVGSPGPMLRSIVGRKPAVASDSTCAEPCIALVESEIIPRLMVAHSREGDAQALAAAVPPGSRSISYHEANAFAPLAITLDASALLDHVDMFVRRGVTIDTIFIDLLAPAARIWAKCGRTIQRTLLP